MIFPCGLFSLRNCFVILKRVFMSPLHAASSTFVAISLTNFLLFLLASLLLFLSFRRYFSWRLDLTRIDLEVLIVSFSFLLWSGALKVSPDIRGLFFLLRIPKTFLAVWTWKMFYLTSTGHVSSLPSLSSLPNISVKFVVQPYNNIILIILFRSHAIGLNTSRARISPS